MGRRNHISQEKRIRWHRRLKMMATARCVNCRRRLDPSFRYDSGRRPWCSRCA